MILDTDTEEIMNSSYIYFYNLLLVFSS